MRDIVPRTTPSGNGNKENASLKRSASTTGKTDVHAHLPTKDSTPVTKVMVEMKTVYTPQSSSSRTHGCQFVTPKTPSNLTRSRSNATALFAKKTPGSSTKVNQQGTTPAGTGNITPGIVKRLAVTTTTTPFRHGISTTPAQQSKQSSTTLAQQNKPGITPVKRKIVGTPLSSTVGSKVGTTPVPLKVAATSESMHQSTSSSSVLTTSQHDQEDDSHVTVAVRVRPLNQREKRESGSVVEACDEGLITVTADTASLSFQYDHCFSPVATQSEVFRSLVHPLLSKALEGYNACLFSYGQTGSGKTYSMMGIENTEEHSRNKMSREAGIIPRFGFSLFERLARGHAVSVEVSYFEIYNEKIRDLLSEDMGSQKTALRVREHPQLGPYVEGLAVHSVASFESLQGWLRLGLSRRATAASAMNDKSSRSHCIFSVTLTQNAGARRSKVHLVDLAGSERLASTSATGDRLKEGVSINTSLLTLGKVISALADKQRRTFVPYRDSLLTWLLSDSLGGNARTVMLATVSPARLYAEETLATLRYACQARTIINRPQLQHSSSVATPVAHRQLQEEVERLRAAREEYERRGAGRELTTLQAELAAVRQKLRDLEKERSEWEERVKASEIDRSRQTAELTRRGVAECSSPVLRLLTSDPSLSLCFALPGPSCLRKVLGSQQPPADITLEAPLVAEKHCILEWRSGLVWLVPGDETAESYVNGELIQEEVPLAHGDRLALGGELFLLVQLESVTSAYVDYEWARMELSLAQNARLNLELAQAKEQAILELQATRAEVEQLGASKNAAEAELQMRQGEQDRLVAALKAEVQEERRRREMALTPMDISLAPFASNLLQDLGELERGFVDAGAGLGLHEMHCLVREATQRCRQLGLHYVFGQVQQALGDPVPGQPALQPCVRVRGKDRQTAFCSPQTFLALLNTLRECEEQGNDTSSVVQVISELAWEEEEVATPSSNLETSVTVDVAPFRRHLLSLSLTVHEESVSSPCLGEVEKHLLSLHTTLAKLQKLTLKQSKVQSQLKIVKNAICQLERACLHPDLDSYQHSEPSTISHQCSESGIIHHNNLESYENSGMSRQLSETSVMLDLPSRQTSQFSEISSIRPESSASGQNGYTDKSSVREEVDEPMYSSMDVDFILNQLHEQVPEPSLSSSVSTATMLHSPPSISAQPTKSNIRLPTAPHSPSKGVRFTLKKHKQVENN